MREILTANDIKALKYACRPGFLMAIGFLFLGAFALIASSPDEWPVDLGKNGVYIVLGLIFFTAFALGYTMSNKYLLDIRYGYKEIIEKKVEKKEFYIDHEPGSGRLFWMFRMKPFHSYNIYIDGNKHNVSKELYDSVTEGGAILLHIGPLSEEILGLEAKK
jgi:hypothetical protein